MSEPSSLVQRYPRTILVIATLVCLIPFADKAFHIDDPLFVWAGRQLQTRWWDPYGFQVNWYGWEMPMHEVTKNPPLACTFIALIIAMFGENEIALHVGFSIQAVAVVLGTFTLARRLCNRPMYAALAALFTPVFLISSTTLMCDVLMVAFWVWAVELWMRGMENNEPLSLVVAALLVGASALAKYFGIALIPLLLVYSLVRTRKLGWWLVYLPIPIAMIVSYEAAMHSLYGHWLLADAFSYASHEGRGAGAVFVTVLKALGFVGGCCAIVLICAPMLWRRRDWITAAIVALFLLPITWIQSSVLAASVQSLTHIGVMLFWTLLILGGLSVLTLPIVEWARDKSAETLMLLLWVCGTLAFGILNWTVNGRSVLPMVPAVAILLLQRIESKLATPRLLLPLGAAAALSVLVSPADYRLANAARTAVTDFQIQIGKPSSTVWFQGHWGFQYYAEANGLRPFDSKHPEARRGDLMVIPAVGTNLTILPDGMIEGLTMLEIPVSSQIATMNLAVGAGFYEADNLRPLPFSFGAVPPEKYYVAQFVQGF